MNEKAEQHVLNYQSIALLQFLTEMNTIVALKDNSIRTWEYLCNEMMYNLLFR